MRYDKFNLIELVKADLHNYPCPRCNNGSFSFKSHDYIIGGPVIVDVYCLTCGNEQMIKFHLNVV